MTLMAFSYQRVINRLGLLAILLGTLMGLAGLRPPSSQAGGPVFQPSAHYRADQTPPGLTATDWRQIVTQVEPPAYSPAEAISYGQIQGASLAQQAYVKASNTEQFDLFGWSVAASGDTVVVGARSEASAAVG